MLAMLGNFTKFLQACKKFMGVLPLTETFFRVDTLFIDAIFNLLVLLYPQIEIVPLRIPPNKKCNKEL